tara:strand:+ start:10116 stop:12581 length:2466 start_codon:yes stop_codon:yes gene_type:complete
MELKDQIEWEKTMLSLGVARFRNQEDKAKERGNYTQTNGGARLLKGYLSQVSEFISHYTAGNSPNGRRRSKFSPLIAAVDPDKLAMFALSVIITAIYEDTPTATVVQKIGGMVEDELKFTKMEVEAKEYFDTILRDLDNKNTTNYRHRHRVFTKKMNDKGIQWRPWDNETSCGVGTLVLSLTLEATDLVDTKFVARGKSSKTILTAKPEVHEWIRSSDESVAVMLPDKMPCLVQPQEWEGFEDGGYYTGRLKMTTAMVKIRRGPGAEYHRELLRNADMPVVRKAVNGMQNTGWRINEKVLAVMQEVWESNLGVGMPQSAPYVPPACPIPRDVKKENMTAAQKETFDYWKAEAREVYEMEKKRQSNVLDVARTMRLGSMLKVKEILYYVYQLDFRGRGYAATSGVSPQGSDHAKAVLQFANAEPLGERGLYWLKVHGANKYGEDKSSYDERVAWIEERHEQWCAVAKDPIGHRKVWGSADKPYQFLAWCFEYEEAARVGASYRSRMPVALDGSCNGLQHFSAMLRDEVGGAAVNLIPSNKPSDIYQQVANVCTEKLRVISRDPEHSNQAAALNWLDLFAELGHKQMPRKLAKKPVMTLPYGSTQQACTSSIFSWYVEQGVKFFPDNTNFKHAIFLSTLMWTSIGEVVIAARAAMSWIQSCAGIVAKAGSPLEYTSPLGFPVYQGSRKSDVRRVTSQIGGAQFRVQIRIDLEDFDPRKQRQGSSPNLVHHADATHMMMCIAAGLDEGIVSFAMIHDDFGVHARHIDRWHEIIREQFYILHSEHSILGNFKAELEAKAGVVLPELPPSGTLDLSRVKDSPYFFG